jgi:hypothetical protein
VVSYIFDLKTYFNSRLTSSTKIATQPSAFIRLVSLSFRGVNKEFLFYHKSQLRFISIKYVTLSNKPKVCYAITQIKLRSKFICFILIFIIIYTRRVYTYSIIIIKNINPNYDFFFSSRSHHTTIYIIIMQKLKNKMRTILLFITLNTYYIGKCLLQEYKKQKDNQIKFSYIH